MRWSPSSQRVWIEIEKNLSYDDAFNVALFTEGVDWNNHCDSFFFRIFNGRPLHRGCGLKSVKLGLEPVQREVALFTEGVDWNTLRPLNRI